jgi:PAS domain S-box-containing protein
MDVLIAERLGSIPWLDCRFANGPGWIGADHDWFICIQGRLFVSVHPMTVRAEGMLGIGAGSWWAGLKLQLRVFLILLAAISVVFIAGAILLYRAAVDERNSIQAMVLDQSVTISNALDREVTAAVFLLRGLSRSPALTSGDLRAFHGQLVETPRPEGAWFVLWDMKGQVLNTLRPFGSRLPTFAEIRVGDADRAKVLDGGLARLRSNGVSISDRVIGPVVNVPTIAVSLRLDGPNGGMAGVLTVSLPQARLNAVVRDGPIPAGWTTILTDRNANPVAASNAQAASASLPIETRDILAASTPGLRLAFVDQGSDLFVGAQASALTGYVIVTTVPLDLLNSPVTKAMRQIAVIAALLLLSATLAGLVAARQVGPVEDNAVQAVRGLRLAEARHSSLWNNTPESLFVVTVTADDRFLIEGFNPAFERATGFTSAAVAGKQPEQCLPPKAAANLTDHCRACRDLGGPVVFDAMLDLPAGQRHWQTSLAPVRDPESGSIIALVGTATDVTAERAATQRIERSQKLLQATLDALSAHVAILDGSGTIIAVNSAWHRYADRGGYATADHGVGVNYVETCRLAASTDPDSAPVASALSAILAGEKRLFRWSYRCLDRAFQMSASSFCHMDSIHVVVTHEDVTDLVMARQDARDIAGRLLSLQEDERQRIASDLHDSTAQHIVAASLELMLVQNAAGDQPGVMEAIASLRTSLEEAQKEIRTLSYVLHPPNLLGNGLAASLRSFLTGFFHRTGLGGTVWISGAVDSTAFDLQRTILRIVQEALVNVYRHAEATTVTVSLRHNGRSLHLRITDNGKGLPSGDVDRSGTLLGVGIPGMEARVRQLGGTMTISGSGRGTIVRVTVPTPLHAEDPALRPDEDRI